MSDRTQIVSSPYHDRARARQWEQVLQAFLDGLWLAGGPPEGAEDISYTSGVTSVTFPVWAHGVRVESAPNGNQHTLVATEHRGH